MSTGQAGSKDQNSKSFRIWRRILVFLSIFNAIGAIGGCCIAFIPGLAASVGADVIAAQLQQNTPFVGQYIQTLFIPGLALLLFVFVPQIIASILLLRKRPKQYIAGIVCGGMLVCVEIVELILIPNPLSLIYLIIGIVQTIAGIMCLRAAG